MTAGHDTQRSDFSDADVTGNAPDMLREVVEAMSEGLALFDEEARLVRCNQSFRELNPLIADVLQPGLNWEIVLREWSLRGAMSKDSVERLRWMESRLATGGKSVPSMEIQLPSGTFHEIAMRPTPVGGFVVTQLDVSERRQLEEHERQADMLLRKVLEACPANVIMSRIGDGHIIYRSPAATELFGTSNNSQDHFASREERADFITALLPDDRVDDMQVTGVRPDGATFPCAVSARVIEYRGEDVVVSSTVDLSREVAMQKELAEQREQIFQAEKMSALGELLSGVAHELNNPLSVVVGHALMMREETTNPDLLRRLEKISVAAERCARIVKSFLAMARQQPARLSPMNLAEAVDLAIEALRNSAGGLNANVEVRMPEDLPRIQGDLDQLVQVVINLLMNAEQAIAASGVGGRVTIAARPDNSGKHVELRVSDDGPGVPKAIRGRIFDPLFTTKDVGKGTGIGLAFCHRVVVSHHGRIRLDSEPGQGATFIVTLPAGTRHAAQPADDPLASAPRRAASILVVDDEADVAELIREILVKDGFGVDYAESPEAALKLVRSNVYALILSDLNMPGIGGRGFYEILMREAPEMARRIGFVTGDTMSPSARGFLDGAGRPYLEKPISPKELRALTQKMLESANQGAGST